MNKVYSQAAICIRACERLSAHCECLSASCEQRIVLREKNFSLYLRTLSLIPNNFYIYAPQDVYMYHFITYHESTPNPILSLLFSSLLLQAHALIPTDRKQRLMEHWEFIRQIWEAFGK